jgi:hypothetical protein
MIEEAERLPALTDGLNGWPPGLLRPTQAFEAACAVRLQRDLAATDLIDLCCADADTAGRPPFRKCARSAGSAAAWALARLIGAAG